MDKQTARTVADGLTWSRILSAIPITIAASYGLTWWVFGLYIAAALTDLLDGVFGRRATPPEKDNDFDGKADVVFSIMTLVWIWMLIPGFFEKYWLPYLPMLLVIEIYLITIRVREPETPVPHFQFGRFAMALFCFLLPVLLIVQDSAWFVHGVFIIGTLSKIQMVRHFAIRNKSNLAEQAEV
ncbi:MAG: CDP-alcohol phosphatidyltransferase family protein [Gammaproteobacteria bacterium]|nr:CDP-alcohol phosphatidyltransferase family protein [Gammaproteobacteria bacterium]